MTALTAPDTTGLPLFQFGGRTYEAKLDAQRLGAQLTRVLQAMSDGKWRTLSEIHAPRGILMARSRRSHPTRWE